ncbi:MAG: LptE family protein [Flavobacteriia bacterium]|nr:LptE family protein [Flavobacteriia bacterium]
MSKFLSLLGIASLTLLSGCTGGYSFTGGDVGKAETISVEIFPNYADYVNPQLSQAFTEELRQIFVQQTPLSLVSSGGDLHFEGSIIGYQISAKATTTSETTAQNRLTISVNVIFTNELEPEKSFEQVFSRFRDFPADQDFSAVEADLVSQINRELSENIFNRALVNW